MKDIPPQVNGTVSNPLSYFLDDIIDTVVVNIVCADDLEPNSVVMLYVLDALQNTSAI